MRTYDSYKDSGIELIGEIPRHWEFLRLGFIVDTIVPMRDKPTDLSGPIPWIRIEDRIGRYIEKSKSNQGVTEELIKEMNLKVYPIGTVLCSCSCSFGKTMIVKEPLTSNQTFIGLVPNDFRLKSEFLSFLLETWEEELENLSSGSIQQYLSRDSFRSLKVLLPPLSEQEQIVSYLDEKTSLIDEMVEKKKRKVELLKEYRTSLINTVVTKGLNPDVPMKDSGIEWIGEIPRHWNKTRLDFLFRLYGRVGWKSLKSEEYVEDGYVFLSTPNIKDKKIDYVNVNYITKERYEESPEIMLENGDVLLVKDGSTLGIVNIVIDLPRPSTVNSSIGVLKRTSEDIIPMFMYYHLTSDYHQNIINRIKGGMGVPHLFQSDIKKFDVVLPPLSEQEQIVTYLDKKTSEIDKTIELENKKIELLKEYRQSLISNVVTGKIKVVSE